MANALANDAGLSVRNALAASIADWKAQQDALGTPFGPVQNPGVANALSSAAYMVPGVGNALAGRDAYNAYNQGDYRGTALGLLGALTFGGPLAKTADAVKLGRAKDLLEAGATPHQIWNETGWFQGADGKWRFEIPDNNAKLLKNPSDMSQYPSTQRLGDVYSHPDLYAAYPELAETGFGLNDKYAMGAGGFGHDEAGNPYIVSGNDPSRDAVSMMRIRELLPHEIQHNIQKIEGFARGGNASAIPFQDQLKPGQYPQIIEQLRQSIQNGDYEIGTPEFQSAAKSLLSLERQANEAHAQDYYNSLAGEAEARNAAKRLPMTNAQRQANPPWGTQDIPYEQQIVRFGNGGGMQASTGAPIKPIYLINDVGPGAHYSSVKEDMENHYGAPHISVVDMGDHYMALEGSNRLAAAKELGLTPTLRIYRPEDRIDPRNFDWGSNPGLDYLHEQGLTAGDIAGILRDTSQGSKILFDNLNAN